MKKMKAMFFITLIFCSYSVHKISAQNFHQHMHACEEKLESLFAMLEKAFKARERGLINETYVKVVLDALLGELDRLKELQGENDMQKGIVTSSRDSMPNQALSGSVNISAESLQQIVASITQSYSSNQQSKSDFYNSLPTWVKVSSVIVSTMTAIQFIAKCYEWLGFDRGSQPLTKGEAEALASSVYKSVCAKFNPSNSSEPT